MKPEIEAKFYPVNKDNFHEKLRQIGARLVGPERKMKRAVFGKEINPQIQGTYARVRDEGDGIIRVSLKTKGVSGGDVKEQKELDFIVSNFEKAREFLTLTGLKESGYQETLRETWEFKNSEIVIDTWPGLEPYTEIESPDEEELQDIVKMLGLCWEEKIITSVSEVFQKVYGWNDEEVSRKLAYLTF